ncbi:hypothetical protein ES705_20566 [subsurface metagenome]
MTEYFRVGVMLALLDYAIEDCEKVRRIAVVQAGEIHQEFGGLDEDQEPLDSPDGRKIARLVTTGEALMMIRQSLRRVKAGLKEVFDGQ